MHVDKKNEKQREQKLWIQKIKEHREIAEGGGGGKADALDKKYTGQILLDGIREIRNYIFHVDQIFEDAK